MREFEFPGVPHAEPRSGLGPAVAAPLPPRFKSPATAPEKRWDERGSAFRKPG